MRKALLLLGLLTGLLGPVAASLTDAYLSGGDSLWPMAWVAWAPMGYLILTRRPGNGVGSALLFIGMTMGMSLALGALSTGSLPLAVRVWLELGNVVLGVAPWIGVVWLLLIFPTGTHESSAQRWVGRLLIGFGVFASMAFAISPEPMDETGEPSPLAVAAVEEVASFVTDQSGFLVVILLTLAAMFLLVRRWRRSEDVQRTQFQWLFLGAALFALILIIGQFVPDDSGALYLWIPGGMAIPIAIGIAILRYRLYDIDRIISRTVTYALVVGLLGLVILGLVTGMAIFLPSDDPLVVAVATLAVFALFNPVRRRVQGLIDRRFNRSRYEAQRVIGSFTETLQEQVDPDEVVEGWVEVVEETMQPASVGVWVR